MANSAPAKNQKAKKKPLTKTQLQALLAERSGLSKKQVAEVLDDLSDVAQEQLRSVGTFTVPKITKLVTVHKKATPEREGIDPFTKQPKTFKAKPARTVVKARVLKGIKDAV